MSAGTSLTFVFVLLTTAISHSQGTGRLSVNHTNAIDLLKNSGSSGCEFKKEWTGRWFLSGVLNPLYINATHIETKGECYEEQGDKYIVYDKTDDCYRCMAIHEKHSSVLQYKETYCDSKAPLQEMCYGITGDAALYSMFRKYPEAKPVPCPFKSAPFTFSYSRGSGDCLNPPSKAESCTDDSRLVLKYQACPDVPSTESNIEELVCLATWKEGSTRYLIGRLSQGNRHTPSSDENQYRCFIYQRNNEKGKAVYNIAQSGDATCTGLQSAFEGSRTMKLTTVDNHHYRCKFPVWITEHHTWLSLDHHKTFKFSQRNATLKILDDESATPAARAQIVEHFGFQEFGFESQDQKKGNGETRVVCHMILQSIEHRKVQIVAHVTSGCNSGYVCMTFYKRDSNVIELQQTEEPVENPDEACTNFNASSTPFTTLITTTLHTKKCPHLGRYTIHEPKLGKKKRQVITDGGEQQPTPDCLGHSYEALAVGCNSGSAMEFRSDCAMKTINEYACHGNWEENGVNYVIASPIARKSTDALRYCFAYTLQNGNVVEMGEVDGIRGLEPTILGLSAISESCHRHIVPGVGGNWAFNFTSNGTCNLDDDSSSGVLIPTLLFVLFSVLIGVIWR